MTTKSVILLSGGLDSVTLAHYVARNTEEKLFPLFFSYGQYQCQPEFDAAVKCVNNLRELGANIDGLQLIDLTEALAHENFENEYIEQRNLIFIAHAARYAEQIAAEKIYIAVIDNRNPNGRYNDTTPNFVRNYSHLLNISGIELVAPFVDKTKDEVFNLSRAYDIKLFDTWSCMHPVKNEKGELEQCGECDNCKLLADMYLPIQAWYDCVFEPAEPFIKAFKHDKIKEIRLAINNKCNLNCNHCFYGFKETKRPELTFEQMTKVMAEAIEAGIEQFHFSGKEPLYDETIFKYTDWLKENYPQIKYDIVTNGVNIPKYLDQIVEAGFYRVCVSFDDFDGGVTRKSSSADAMKMLTDRGQHVAAFMCLTKENMDHFIENMIIMRGEYGVKELCVVPLHCSGKGKGMADLVLTSEDMYTMYKRFKGIGHLDVRIDSTFKGSYIEALFEGGHEDFEEEIINTARFGDYQMGPNYFFMPELFCNSFDFNVTLLSDGFMLGCAVEVTGAYDKLAVGNVMDTPVKDLFKKGKELTIERMTHTMKCAENNSCKICTGECFHNKYCYKCGSLKA